MKERDLINEKTNVLKSSRCPIINSNIYYHSDGKISSMSLRNIQLYFWRTIRLYKKDTVPWSWISWLISEWILHYSDDIISSIASQITGVSIAYSTVCSGADQRKHKSSTSLVLVRGIHRWPVNSPHKGPVTRKMFPFDDVTMWCFLCGIYTSTCNDIESHKVAAVTLQLITNEYLMLDKSVQYMAVFTHGTA